MAARGPARPPGPAAPAAAAAAPAGPPAPAPAAPAAPAAPTPQPGAGQQSSGGRSNSSWNQPGWAPTAGGVVLGAFAVVLFVQYSRGGTAEVKKWFAAKFLNKSTAGGKALGALGGAGSQALQDLQGMTLGGTMPGTSPNKQGAQ